MYFIQVIIYYQQHNILIFFQKILLRKFNFWTAYLAVETGRFLRNRRNNCWLFDCDWSIDCDWPILMIVMIRKKIIAL